MKTMKSTPRRLLTVVGLLLSILSISTIAHSTPLRCEFLRTPMGIEEDAPALSWTIADERRGVEQVAYRVLVASSEKLLAENRGDLWDSGVVKSDQSHLVEYAGKPLISRQRCYWKAEVQTIAADEPKPVSTWTEPSWWEMGLLDSKDWKGPWIQAPACKPVINELSKRWTEYALVPLQINKPPFTRNKKYAEAGKKEGVRMMNSLLPAPIFRKAFDVPGEIKQARLYISGLGFHEAYINGQPINDHMHDPSVNVFDKRAGYIVEGITDQLKTGENTITATLGGGFWHESIIWNSPERVKVKPSLRAQVEVELVSGEKIIVPTDASWSTAVGPILKTHYYAGEIYDARRDPNWKNGEMGDVAWNPATEVKDQTPKLEAQLCEPERVVRRVKAVAKSQPRPGIWVFDLGELISGTVELNIKAKAGQQIVMRTAEWTWNPDKQGDRFTSSRIYYENANLRERTPGMLACRPRGGTYFSWSFAPEGIPGRVRNVHLGVPTLLYVANGNPAGERWRPTFTSHPFRYIEVIGLTEEPPLDLVTGLVITNDEEKLGTFTAENKLFNEIWEASMNSTRYNTHGMSWDNSVERLQSQVYHAWSAPFASYELWYPNLWRKVLTDLRLGNRLNPKAPGFGNVVYGSRFRSPPPIYAVTQSVNIELPMQYFDRYGDFRELKAHYPHMKAWVEAFFPNKDGVIKDEATMGAWSDHFYKESSSDGPWMPHWDHDTMMSMMMVEYARDTAEVARMLGKTSDAESLDQLAEQIRSVINEKWYNAEAKTYCGAKKGKEIDNSTGWHAIMAMAIAKGIAPEEDIPAILDNCIKDMKLHYNGHYAAGHITHQLIYDVYSEYGLIETCYDMMTSTAFPSFHWMLQSGNKTIPEGPSLPKFLPAKSSACQNECQEPARWFSQTLCGVSPDRKEPAFKHIKLRPYFPARLPAASLTTTTAYGPMESSWKREGGAIVWKVTIPANSYASALFPVTSAEAVKEGATPLSDSKGCSGPKSVEGGIECRVGSGTYQFSFPAPTYAASKLPNK